MRHHLDSSPATETCLGGRGMNEFEPTPVDAKIWRCTIASALLGTLALGFWLWWSLAGDRAFSLDASYLRHAHAHLGYFGLLFPLAWLGWRPSGARPFGPGALLCYAICTALTCLGIAFYGYGPVVIIGSALLAALLIWSSLGLFLGSHQTDDPLVVVPWGVIVSLLCVIPIVMSLRSDNAALASDFASTLLASSLFLVVIPSAMAGRRITVGPWQLLFTTGLLGALFLGVVEHPVARVGLLAHAMLLLTLTRTTRLEVHTRCAWGMVAAGLGAMATGLLPNTRPVALGAIHFLILGPVLATLAPLWLKRPPPSWMWWLGHLSWGSMSAALLAQEFVASSWTWTIVAASGLATTLWWLLVLAYPWRDEPPQVHDQSMVMV